MTENAVVDAGNPVLLAIRFGPVYLSQYAMAASASMAPWVDAPALAGISKPAILAGPDKSYRAIRLGSVAVVNTYGKIRRVHVVHELAKAGSMIGHLAEHLELPLVDHLMCHCFAQDFVG